MTCLAFAASQSFRTDLLMIRRCVKFRQPCEPSGLPESNYQSTTDEVEKTTNGISSQQLMSQTSHMLLANDKWKWRTKDMVVQFCTSSSRWYLQFWTFWSWLTLSEMTWHISKHCCSRLWINLKPTFVSKWGLCGKSAEGIFFLEKKSIFTLELLQKSDFQPLTTKPDNIGHPTVKTGQIWPLGWFCIF